MSQEHEIPRLHTSDIVAINEDHVSDSSHSSPETGSRVGGPAKTSLRGRASPPAARVLLDRLHHAYEMPCHLLSDVVKPVPGSVLGPPEEIKQSKRRSDPRGSTLSPPGELGDRPIYGTLNYTAAWSTFLPVAAYMVRPVGQRVTCGQWWLVV